MRRFTFFAVGVLLLVPRLAAQQPTGFPPYGSFRHGGFDSINVENLNVNFSIPIVSVPGRGSSFNYAITYNSAVWMYHPNGGSGWYWIPVSIFPHSGSWGWNYDPGAGGILYDEFIEYCEPSDEYALHVTNFRLMEPNGTTHSFALDFYDVATECSFGPVGGQAGHSTDGQGFKIDATGWPYVGYGPDGAKFVGFGPATVTDANGNYFTTGPTPLLNTWVNYTDMVGRTVLKIYKEASKVTYQYQDASGAWQTVELNLSTFNIKTNFACPSVSEYTGTAKLPVSLVLANGKQYTFTYEDTPGWAGYKSGRLKRVTFPTGGYYEYSYPTTGNKGISCPSWSGGDGRTTSLTRVINDGVSSSTWQYSATMSGTYPNHFWTTTVTAPTLPYDSVGNQSSYTFGSQGNSRTETHYQGSSSALRTIQTTFTPDANWVKRPTTIVTILENDQQSKVENTFDLFGNVTEVREYDWGSGAPGTSVIRKTTTSYLSTSAYTQRNILNRPTQIKVMDGTGVALQQTDILYDETTPIATSGAVQHDYTNYSNSFNYRGNPTSVKRLVSGTTFLTTTNTYDDLGNLRSTTDPGSHTTNFSYADNFSDGVNRNTFAYLTQVTKPSPFNGQTIQTKYYYPTGQARSTIDENSRETIAEYSDSMKRPTRTTSPDGGETTIAYDDTARTVTTTQKRTSTETVSVVEQFDQLGRLSQTQLPGSRKVDVVYDVVGREWKTSNPYVSQGESTYGIAEARFDGLGRIKTVINQDLTSAQTEYAGNSVRVTDETGKQHISQADALGRLTRVCEVTAGNTRSPSEGCGMTGFGGGTGYLTTYSYSQDSNENVTQISQGSQTRILRADKAGRQKSSKVIEVSTTAEVTYAFDNDGNQTSVTDQRGTVCFEYDALHRLKRKRHPTGAQNCTNGNIAAEFAYDGTQANNAIGRLITEWDGTAGSSDKNDYTYDTLGRVLTANRTASSTVYAMAYTYDLAGNLSSISYPSSSGTRRKVDYLYNANTELNIVRDTTGTAFDYITATSYSNLGPMQQLDLGNGVRTTLSWNKNGEMTSLVTQKVGGATHLSLGYTYFNNGQIQEIGNALNNLKSEKYTYDQLRRLFTAQRGPDASVRRKYQYDYDRYGNRWAQVVVAGSGLGGTLDLNSANNRVTTTGFSYMNGSGQDQAGNLTANGPGSSYTYNMENFMTAAGSTAYAYDAQGRRVRKTVGGTVTEYFYSGSELIAENTGGTWTDYIFFGDQRIAKQTGTTLSTTTFLHTDHLGSTRVCTDSSGLSTGTCDYEPFGEIQPGTTCSVPTNFRFAGMEWDANAGPNGLYHTWFRQYDPNQGRWMAVDPLAGDAIDPQSLDRFAYALNDPANFTDPLGLAVFEGGRLHTEFLYNGLSVGADFLVDTGILKFWDIVNLSLWSHQLGESLWVSDIHFSSLLALLQAKEPQKPEGSCDRIAGKGGVVRAPTPHGDARLEFNARGFVTGVGIQLTGSSGRLVNGVRIPPNTSLGARLIDPNTVSFGFNQPVKTPNFVFGVIGAYVRSATFSGTQGKFTQVLGAVSILGIPMGRRSTPSNKLLNTFNQNPNVLDVGSRVLKALQWSSQNIRCTDLFF